LAAIRGSRKRRKRQAHSTVDNAIYENDYSN